MHDAQIEIVLPAQVPFSEWHHRLLGREEAIAAPAGTRARRWTLRDAQARRFEEGTPRTERDVRVCISTTKWADVARARTETLLALDERLAEVSAWATRLRKDTADATVTAVVEAAGKSIAQASPVPLLADSDGDGTRPERKVSRPPSPPAR